MKPRHLIETEERAGAELALALERIAALEERDKAKDVELAALKARQDRLDDRQLVGNARLSEVEARLPGRKRAAPEDSISVKEAAYRTGYSPSSIYAHRRQGKIAGEKLGGRVLIDAAAAK
jgi:hypothetical protein